MSYKSLQYILTSIAWNILSRLRKPLQQAVSVEVNQDGVTVRVEINPTSLPVEKLPGRFFSDAEARVWACLRPDEVLMGKEIAARLGYKYEDPKFKYLLQTLEAREVLAHEDGKGYSRASLLACIISTISLVDLGALAFI